MSGTTKAVTFKPVSPDVGPPVIAGQLGAPLSLGRTSLPVVLRGGR
jgi:hypothetical protein